MSGADHPADKGRGGCDWEQAFLFWAALPAGQRSYAAVAARFGVSVRTVERRGRDGDWRGRLQAINLRAAAEADERLGHEKGEQIGRLRKLIEATMVSYAQKLRDGEIRMAPGDLDRLYKLWRQLDDELTDNATTTPETPTAAVRPSEQTAAVVRALAESGALAELGLQLVEPKQDEEENEQPEQEEVA